MAESTLMKAHRLPIRILQHDATSTIADVTGDHGTWRVTAVREPHHHHDLNNDRIVLNDYPACEKVSNLSTYYGPLCHCTVGPRGSDASVSCSCPASVEACSHVLALALWVKEQR